MLVGGVLDIVLSSVLGVPFVIYVIVTSNLHPAEGQLPAAVTGVIHARPALYAVQLAIGLACTALGGYIYARIAKHDEVLNGLLASSMCILLGVYSMVSGKQHTTPLEQVALFGLTILAGLFGGYLRARSVRARPSIPSAPATS